jgi:hypothetical protein
VRGQAGSIMLIHKTNGDYRGGIFGYLHTLQGRDFMRQKINYISPRTDFSAAWYIAHFGIPVFPFQNKIKTIYFLSTDRKNWTNKEGRILWVPA